jgi:hypothetical protein
MTASSEEWAFHQQQAQIRQHEEDLETQRQQEEGITASTDLLLLFHQ